MERIVTFLSISLLKTFDFFAALFTANKPILEEDEFGLGGILKANHAVFLEEYQRYALQREVHNLKDFYKVKTDLKNDDNWKALPIVLFGYSLKENASQFQGTVHALEQMPGCCGIMFSVLLPGKHIPPHQGIYKGVYRCLYTLQVEKGGDCWIRIGNEKKYFKEGECIVFDETVDHEVRNASQQPRVVLYLDIYRRLPFPVNFMNDFIFFLLRKSAFVMNILTEYKNLENTSTENFTAAPAQLR